MAEWDDLACRLGAPRSAPACVLAWYRNVLADDSRIRLVTVHDGEALAGVLPLYVDRDHWGFVHYRMAGHQTLVGVEPLLDPDHADDAARLLAEHVHRLRPVPDVVQLEAVPAAMALLERASDAWPGRRPRVAATASIAPFLSFPDGGYEEWVARRAGRTTRESRRSARRLTEAGYTQTVLTDPEEIVRRLPELRRLYLDRKEARGGWGASFSPAMLAMIEDLTRALAPLGRATMFTWEQDGTALAAHFVLTAGGTASGWLGAVGTRETKYSPGSLNVERVVEWAHDEGLCMLDLGPGDEQYKDRDSNGARTIEDAVLRRRDLFPLNTPAALVPSGVRRAVRSLRERGSRRV